MAQHMIEAGQPPEVSEALETNYLRVQAATCAARLWDRHLSCGQRRQLGNDIKSAYRDGGTVGIWMRLHGVGVTRAVIDLAKMLNFVDDATQCWLLRATGETSDDPEEALQLALARSDLVLTEQTRAVYWMGAMVEVDWYDNGAMWEYFLTLCERAKQGQGVDAADFGDRRKADNHIKQKSRLTTKTPGFPMDLGSRIESEVGGRQKLDIPPQRITIIRSTPAGV
jgi:hypothetical protein